MVFDEMATRHIKLNINKTLKQCFKETVFFSTVKAITKSVMKARSRVDSLYLITMVTI